MLPLEQILLLIHVEQVANLLLNQLAVGQEKALVEPEEKMEDLVEVLENHLIVVVLEIHHLQAHLKETLVDQEGGLAQEILV